jgi:hypothetical protein
MASVSSARSELRKGADHSFRPCPEPVEIAFGQDGNGNEQELADRPGAGERWLSDLAVDLDMPYASLHAWVRRGWLRTRKVEGAAGMLAAAADAEEMSRLCELRDHRREYLHRTPPTELTTPRLTASRRRRTQK